MTASWSSMAAAEACDMPTGSRAISFCLREGLPGAFFRTALKKARDFPGARGVKYMGKTITIPLPNSYTNLQTAYLPSLLAIKAIQVM